MYVKYGKRTLDIVSATLALVFLTIPMLLIAFWIRFDSEGPILFKQKRYGQNKKPFIVYKFRSMAIHAPSDRATSDFHDSHTYITRAGKIMRKLSIDELPQLFNVIKGDMSLIGPRPLIEKHVIKLRDKNGSNDVRPGITGWAQANGRDDMDDATKVDFDGYYAANIGVIMDIKVVLKTIYAIIVLRGHAEGHERAASKDDRLVAGD